MSHMSKLPKTITIHKEIGETPLNALDRLRKGDARLKWVKLTYAGRLDPMASGRLLVLVGEECKNFSSYHGLDKEYVIEVLFGIESDTGDVLGIAKSCDAVPITKQLAESSSSHFVGDFNVPYPAYSSKTVNGKPLFQWALEGRLGEIEIPVRESHIYNAHVNSVKNISRRELERQVESRIALMPGVTEPSKELGRDFRRADVLDSWKSVLGDNDEEYAVAQITVTCSSGTYMRSLAQLLAKNLGTCGLALSINRTRIGKFFPLWKIGGFWRKEV